MARAQIYDEDGAVTVVDEGKVHPCDARVVEDKVAQLSAPPKEVVRLLVTHQSFDDLHKFTTTQQSKSTELNGNQVRRAADTHCGVLAPIG